MILRVATPSLQVPEAGSTYRPDIDGLRAVAVSLVLLFHAGLGFTGGYVGVNVFFVGPSGHFVGRRTELPDVESDVVSSSHSPWGGRTFAALVDVMEYVFDVLGNRGAGNACGPFADSRPVLRWPAASLGPPN